MIRRLAPLALLLAAPGAARVVATGDAAITVEGSALVAAPPERVWATVVAPSRWWPPSQAVSGDAANLQLGERAGGCLCEALPGGGAVEHARVLRIEPVRMLRLAGALGPLQPQPVTGVFTVTLAAEAGGTRVRLLYVAAGAAAPPLSAMASLVDAMLGEQLARLKAAAERPAPPSPPPAKRDTAAPKQTNAERPRG